jgi:hypothetical protein
MKRGSARTVMTILLSLALLGAAIWMSAGEGFVRLRSRKTDVVQTDPFANGGGQHYFDINEPSGTTSTTTTTAESHPVLKRASDYAGDSGVEMDPDYLASYVQQEGVIGKLIAFLRPKAVLRYAPTTASSAIAGITGPAKYQVVEEIRYRDSASRLTGTWLLLASSGSGTGWARAVDLQDMFGVPHDSPLIMGTQNDDVMMIGHVVTSEKDLKSGVRVNVERYGMVTRRCPVFAQPGFNINKGKEPIAYMSDGTYIETTSGRLVVDQNIVKRWYEFTISDGTERTGWIEMGYVTFNEEKMDRDTYVKMLREDGWFDVSAREKVSSTDSRAIAQIVCNRALSAEQKQAKLQVYQDSLGAEVVAAVIRGVPVYDSDTKVFHSFDSFVRNLAGTSSVDVSGTPFEKDPVGASIRIFMDPSASTISSMLGLGN